MKKICCVALVCVLTLGLACGAMAESFSSPSLDPGKGWSPSWTAKKTSGVGVSSSVTATASSSRAIFQATTRKTDGVPASETERFTGSCSGLKLATKYDGNQKALLRTGYTYVLRIAHRSNSPISSASASGTWEP